jgi:hypothetical protein
MKRTLRLLSVFVTALAFASLGSSASADTKPAGAQESQQSAAIAKAPDASTTIATGAKTDPLQTQAVKLTLKPETILAKNDSIAGTDANIAIYTGDFKEENVLGSLQSLTGHTYALAPELQKSLFEKHSAAIAEAKAKRMKEFNLRESDLKILAVKVAPKVAITDAAPKPSGQD